MTPEQLVDKYPVLHHMAQAGSWPAIEKIGLRTTEQLVEACSVDSETKVEILTKRRKHSFTLHHPVVGPITVRDQQPLQLHNLLPKLSGVSIEAFLASLNDRVFLWAHPDRLTRLLSARLYRDHKHDVLVVDTAKLLEIASDRVRLAGMNTGSAIFPNTPVRDQHTFSTIEDFDFDARQAARKALRDNVVEVCVLGGVDIAPAVTCVQSRRGPQVTDVIYEA